MNSHKIKERKNVTIKQVVKVYQVKYTLYFETLVLALHKIQTSFKTIVSKKATIRRLEKSQSNDKLLQKTMSSSYQME